MSVKILVGDCLTLLRGLPAESVHCCVTSPPYWGLRSYKGDAGMIGLEPTFDEHLANLVEVFREVRRVLRKDGTCWLNYGDAYAGGGRRKEGDTPEYVGGLSGKSQGTLGSRPMPLCGYKPKDLMMMPARVALALQADGWWIRSEIVWHKPNPMPESCTDRPTSSHEKLYLLSKSARYFYDAESVRTADLGRDHRRNVVNQPDTSGGFLAPHNGIRSAEGRNGSGANLRNVWTIPTHSFSAAHFATFPPKLVEPCIQAGTSEKGVCSECGAPWVRSIEKKMVPVDNGRDTRIYQRKDDRKENAGQSRRVNSQGVVCSYEVKTTGWNPTCQCKPQTSVPATVLDPFAGSGTVALVAQRMNRDAILIEISPEYAEMARKRIESDAPMFAAVEVQA